jgi:exopolysaccharide production protein ExoZ
MSGGRNLLVNLQLCRAFAAIMVVVGHSLHDVGSISGHGDVDLEYQMNWGFGVDVFFVISGFIMVHVSAPDFATPNASWRFLSRRLIRIVPLYWTLTTLLIVGSCFAPGLLNVPIGGLGHIINSYLFIPDWRPDMSAMRPVMALGWTLNYEMMFYVLFACAMFLPLNRAVLLLTSVFVGAVVFKMLFHIDQSQFSYWMDPLILEFLLGVYLAMAYRAGWRLSAVASLALTLAALASLTTGLVDALGLDTDVHILRYGVPALMLVAAAALGPALPDSIFTRFGAGLGDASYALYLVHPFVIRPLRAIWSKLGGAHWPAEMFCALSVLCAVIVALALHRFFERPVVRALHKWSQKPVSGRASLILGAERNV